MDTKRENDPGKLGRVAQSFTLVQTEIKCSHYSNEDAECCHLSWACPILGSLATKGLAFSFHV